MHAKREEKLEYIHWLKGLGIVLVVFGHFYASLFVLPGFETARNAVYIFHMPLFMAISGFLYARAPRLSVGALLKKKFGRLLVPYISISGVILAAKLTAGLLHFGLRRPVNVQDGLAFLFYPHQGFACFLWYLYTLFVIFGVMGLLDLFRTPLWMCVAVAVGARFLPLPPYFCLDLAGQNLIYFVLGMVFARLAGTVAARNFRTNGGLVVGAWMVFGALAWLVQTPGAKIQVVFWSASIAGIIASWLTALRLGQGGGGVLAWLGRASSAIYLLHTLVMGVVRYIWEEHLGVDSSWARILFLTSSVGLGLVLPVWFQQYVLDRIPHASRLFLGLDPAPRPSAPQQNP